MPAEPDKQVELTLVIPAYNEASIILQNVDELEQWMSEKLTGTTYEILIIDDGSSDGTGEKVASRAADDSRVRLVRHPTNLGRGRAIRTGFENARGAFLICLDADLSYAPYHIERLLTPLQRNEADITLASAYHPKGSVTNVPWSRVVLSRSGNRVLSAGVYGQLHTTTCSVRGYRREALDKLELIGSGKDLHLEIIQKALLFGLRIKEVPADLKWREYKQRKRRVGKGRLRDRIPFLSMSGTIASHLVYNYVLRPGSMFHWPVIALLVGSFILALTLVYTWLARFFSPPGDISLYKLYGTLRETLLQGQLTFLLLVASLLISLIFLAFYFASQQNKKNFEEVYVLLSRINERLKQLEKQIDR